MAWMYVGLALIALAGAGLIWVASQRESEQAPCQQQPPTQSEFPLWEFRPDEGNDGLWVWYPNAIAAQFKTPIYYLPEAVDLPTMREHGWEPIDDSSGYWVMYV